jgi:hypothetical protein
MSTNPYSNPYASSKREIDLRKELEDTLYGTSNEISKGVKGLLRKMRRNSSGVLQRCACRDILTDEPDLDSYCRYCVLPSSIIPTEDGCKQAKDVQPGNKVLAKDGEYHTVMQAFSRLYSGNIVSIFFAGRTNIPLSLTADHTVFVLKEPLLCHQKKSFNQICLPDLCKTRNCKVQTTIEDDFLFQFEEKKAEDVKEGDYVVFPRKTSFSKENKKLLVNWEKYAASNGPVPKSLPSELNIDEDLMFLLGWYVAEGSGDAAGRKTRAVVYSLHSEKEQEIAIKLLKIFKEKFNINGVLKYKKIGKCVQVVFNHSLLSRWLHDLCGRYSDHKKVPNFIWSSSKRLQLVFLNNFMLGDGHRNNQNVETAGISSYILAEEIYILALHLGLSPSISYQKEHTDKDKQYHSDSWYVYWLDSLQKNLEENIDVLYQPTKWRSRFNKENYIFSKVTKINIEEMKVPVYDFSVEEEHSFVANGMLVHNCLGHGYYWDEIPITYYRNSTPFGRQEENTREYLSHIFYLEYDVPVTSDDYIVSVRLDTEGNVIIPVVRDSYYRILSADPYRGENGRIEFFAVRAVEEREWSVNYGVRNRQVS